MAKNAGRKGRWTQRDARTYTSSLGPVVYRQDAWYARLAFQVREAPEEGGLPAWVAWLGLHIAYLRGARNRLVVLLDWIAAYVSRGRGAGIITRRGRALRP